MDTYIYTITCVVLLNREAAESGLWFSEAMLRRDSDLAALQDNSEVFGKKLCWRGGSWWFHNFRQIPDYRAKL